MADITIFQGDTPSFTVTYADSTGSPLGIDGGVFTVRKGLQAADPATLELTVGSGITISDGPNGELTWTMTRAQTLALAAGSYVASVEGTSSGIRVGHANLTFVVLPSAIRT